MNRPSTRLIFVGEAVLVAAQLFETLTPEQRKALATPLPLSTPEQLFPRAQIKPRAPKSRSLAEMRRIIRANEKRERRRARNLRITGRDAGATSEKEEPEDEIA